MPLTQQDNPKGTKMKDKIDIDAEPPIALPIESDHMTDWIYDATGEPLFTIQFVDEDIEPEEMIKMVDFIIRSVNTQQNQP